MARNKKVLVLENSVAAQAATHTTSQADNVSARDQRIKGKDTFLIQNELLQRGWTKSLIIQLLGEPDKVHRRMGDGEYYLFDHRRVQRAEKRKCWQVEFAKKEARKTSRLTRRLIVDYLEEVTDSAGDETEHWLAHPEVEAFERSVAEARRQTEVSQALAQERELLGRFGILPCLFSINREAKRERDAAKKAWLENAKAKAGEHAEHKRELYRLKSQVLEHLWRDGYLEHVGWHSFGEGKIAELLGGGGYRFHRPFPTPRGPIVLIPEIEAKPADVNEVPANLAEKAVRGFLQGRSKLDVFVWPGRERKQPHYQVDLEHDEEDQQAGEVGWV